MRLVTRFLPLALVAALLAAGCGSGGSTESTGSEGAETTQAHQSGAGAPIGVMARPCHNTGKKALLMRVTGVSCAKGTSIATVWRSHPECPPAGGESRSACTVGGFRCFATVAGRGLAVTCARPERSISFIAPRG
ncbi:MAG TPA: hypothetical protein VGF09_05475 [Solirubrobacterales bacterium]